MCRNNHCKKWQRLGIHNMGFKSATADADLLNVVVLAATKIAFSLTDSVNNKIVICVSKTDCCGMP